MYLSARTPHRSAKRLAGFAACALMLSACAETPSAPIPIDPEGSVAELIDGTPGPFLSYASLSSGSQATDQERKAGEFVARSLALALRDPAIRAEVKRAIVTSSVREHKLHLTSFLSGRGGRILAAAYRNAGISPAEFQSAMAQMREMEFYMPVSAHRAIWRGGSDLLVAVAFERNENPIAFSPGGVRSELSRTGPPSIPVLAIVPKETNFGEQIRLNTTGLIKAACGVTVSESLESASARCELKRQRGYNSRSAAELVPRDRGSLLTEITPAMHTSAFYAEDPQNLGLYATFLRALDLHESWYEGAPEVEIHVMAKRNGANGVPVDYQCAAEYANDPTVQQPGIRDQAYVFDMNDNFWQDQTVRLLSAAQLDSLDISDLSGFQVVMWESTGGDCTIEEETPNSYHDAANAAAAVARGAGALHGRHSDWAVIAGSINALADILSGGDALIGIFVYKDSTSFAGTNPGNNFMIYDGGTQNGRATLILNRTNRGTTMSGPVVLTEGAMGHWSASATGYSGSLAYTWYVDGEVVQDGGSSSLSYGAGGDDFSVSVTATDVGGPLRSSFRRVTVNPAGCGGKVC